MTRGSGEDDSIDFDVPKGSDGDGDGLAGWEGSEPPAVFGGRWASPRGAGGGHAEEASLPNGIPPLAPLNRSAAAAAGGPGPSGAAAAGPAEPSGEPPATCPRAATEPAGAGEAAGEGHEVKASGAGRKRRTRRRSRKGGEGGAPGHSRSTTSYGSNELCVGSTVVGSVTSGAPSGAASDAGDDASEIDLDAIYPPRPVPTVPGVPSLQLGKLRGFIPGEAALRLAGHHRGEGAGEGEGESPARRGSRAEGSGTGKGTAAPPPRAPARGALRPGKEFSPGAHSRTQSMGVEGSVRGAGGTPIPAVAPPPPPRRAGSSVNVDTLAGVSVPAVAPAPPPRSPRGAPARGAPPSARSAMSSRGHSRSPSHPWGAGRGSPAAADYGELAAAMRGLSPRDDYYFPAGLGQGLEWLEFLPGRMTPRGCVTPPLPSAGHTPRQRPSIPGVALDGELVLEFSDSEGDAPEGGVAPASVGRDGGYDLPGVVAWVGGHGSYPGPAAAWRGGAGGSRHWHSGAVTPSGLGSPPPGRAGSSPPPPAALPPHLARSHLEQVVSIHGRIAGAPGSPPADGDSSKAGGASSSTAPRDESLLTTPCPTASGSGSSGPGSVGRPSRASVLMRSSASGSRSSGLGESDDLALAEGPAARAALDERRALWERTEEARALNTSLIALFSPPGTMQGSAEDPVFSNSELMHTLLARSAPNGGGEGAGAGRKGRHARGDSNASSALGTSPRQPGPPPRPAPSKAPSRSSAAGHHRSSSSMSQTGRLEPLAAPLGPRRASQLNVRSAAASDWGVAYVPSADPPPPPRATAPAAVAPRLVFPAQAPPPPPRR